jgi:hypothetical protein
MAMFKKCANCNTTIAFGGIQDGEQNFCSRQCQEWAKAPGFCQECTFGTTNEGLGGTFTMNAVGTKIYALGCSGGKCTKCGSVPMRKWFVALFIPLFPVSAQYRVKYCAPTRYVSRKIGKKAEQMAMASSAR